MATFAPSAFVREMLRRQACLGGYALLCLAGALVTSICLLLDDRMIDGVSVWLKPTKFFLSIAVFSGTMAWFFGHVRPQRRSSVLMRLTVAVLLLTASYELFWITWQGAHGLHSHFNFDTPLYALMYSLMGVGAVSLAGTTLPLAWEIGRRPAEGLDPAYRLAVILGLVITFALGGSFGGYISASGGSAVGEYASNMPLFAWNRVGGDLRVPHFFGMHALQATPLLAIALASLGWRGKRAALTGSAVYVALTLGLWFAARSGLPFVPF